ncbi:unnamed protein product [Tilletia controversa]|nr:unnamed protein product [Tilletia controversa]
MAKQTQILVAAKAKDNALHVAGFTVLPIRYSARHLKHGTVHYLFIRSNQSTSQQLPQHRTLFVANLPTDTSQTHLRTLFKNAGALERIHFQHNTSTRPLAGQHIIDALTSTQPEHDDHHDHDDDDEPDIIQPQREPNAALLQSKLEEQNTRKRNKRKRKQDQQQQNAPHVTPLPPLHPRELPYLPTATSAHIIFLDDSSLQRALAQAHVTSAAFVAAGGPALLLPSASPKKPELLALLKAARPWPADPSTTTTTTTQQPQTQAQQQPPPPAGLPTLLASYQSHRPSLSTIKSFTDTRIALHSFLRLHPHLDPTEQARAQRRTAIQAVSVGAQGELLDSDGFTIVTAGGKYGRTAETGSKVGGGGVEGASVRVARNRPYMASGDAFDAEKGPPRKKSKSKDLEDFYRFQTREKNREKLAQLRAKFQEDKVKVAKLKESRKFKP